MNGANLTDWQYVYNKLNERIKAVQNIDGLQFSLSQVEIPKTKSHLKSEDLGFFPYSFLAEIPLGKFCNPTSPLYIIDENSELWPFASDYKGNYIYKKNSLNVNKTIPQYGDYPSRGDVIENSGWFLDYINSALSLLVKSTDGSRSLNYYRAYMHWNQQSGEVWDYVSGEYITGVSFSSFLEFYQYVKSHLTQIQNPPNTAEAKTSIEYDGNQIFVDLIYSYYNITVPGFASADVRIYFSSEGENLGWPVTNYEYTEAGQTLHHVDYSTRDFSNVTPGNQIQVGFSSSVFPESPTLPAVGSPFNQMEELKRIFAVCDFSSYLTYTS